MGNWTSRCVVIIVTALRVFRTVCTITRRTIGHPSYVRVVRGAFLAPWFAVSLGVAAAAIASVVSPATTLTFPSTRAGQCAVAGCGDSRPEQGSRERTDSAAPRGSWPGRRPEPVPSLRRHPMSVARTQQPDALRIQYRLLKGTHYQFTAMILVTAHTRLGKWTLDVRLPGARIGTVMWAKWTFAKNGAIVIHGQPSPRPRSASDEARIVIFGTGQPSQPAGCVYNGLSCTFAPLTAKPGAR